MGVGCLLKRGILPRAYSSYPSSELHASIVMQERGFQSQFLQNKESNGLLTDST